MYIRFLKNYMFHKKGKIINTSNAAGDVFIKRKIAEEMVEDYMNNDKLITAKEFSIREDKKIKEIDKKFEEEKRIEEKIRKEKREKEQQDLIDIEDELEKQEKQETPIKRKRGRPRKSPNNKMTNTNNITTK